MNQLNAFLALETIHDNIERAERHPRAHPAPEHPPARGGRRPSGRRPLRRALAVLRRAPAALRN